MRYPPSFGPGGYQAPLGPPPMPPTGQQSYGLQPVPGGQMQSAYFQYSQCNGKKKALLVRFHFEFPCFQTLRLFTDRYKLHWPARGTSGLHRRCTSHAEIPFGLACFATFSISDAISITGRGYKEEDMVILTDNSSHPRQQPTRQNMVRRVPRPISGDLMVYKIDAMHWLVRDARPNDSLFFHCMLLLYDIR